MVEFNFQDFRFIGSDFREAFGIFQFKYKGYEISACNRGALATKVAIFKDKDSKWFHETNTVEEAIAFVDKFVRIQTS